MSSTLLPRQSGGGLDVFQFYYYEPSMAAAAIFVVAFGITTLLHCWQMFKTKTWFLIPFLIGGFCTCLPPPIPTQPFPPSTASQTDALPSAVEVIGYIGRALSAAENPGHYTLGPYVMQSTLILVAPALFAASIYMELGRIVHMIQGDHALFVRRTWLTKIFVGGDVLSFLMQASGAGLLAAGDSPSAQDTGEKVIVGGLFAQIVFFGTFVIAALIFEIRQRKNPTALSLERPWKKHMISLYVVSILIFVRSIVRVVEYLQGYDGYLMVNEVFIYVFDALPMAVSRRNDHCRSFGELG